MRDRVPTKPNRYAVYDDSHNFLRYEYHERADEPTQAGTPLNKANLLSDVTSAYLRLSGDPTVDDALRRLAGVTLIIVNVHTVPGSAVGITLGTDEFTATADASGLAVLRPTRLGVWALTVTTGNATYTGSIEVSVVGITDVSFPSFEVMAWADIDAVGQGGSALIVFERGDERKVTLTTSEVITLRIEDFNHDDLSTGGKAPITLGMKNLLAETQQMNSTTTNTGSWNASAMRSRMNTYRSRLPTGLKDIVKPVIKKTTAGNRSADIQNTTDSVWLFSAVELGLLTTETGTKDEGTTYPLYTNDASRIKYPSNDTTETARRYWTRSPWMGHGTAFIGVDTGGRGDYTNNNATASLNIGLGFCI